jgi:soluble P-type ATPase
MSRSGISIDVPGRGPLRIEALLIDVNGTLGVDGRVAPEVTERLRRLAERIRVVVATADTFGTARDEVSVPGVEVVVLGPGSGAAQKETLLQELGAETSAAVGNGYNDHRMVGGAALGIAVVGREGAYGDTVRSATVVVADVADALDLLLVPKRLIATLRD